MSSPAGPRAEREARVALTSARRLCDVCVACCVRIRQSVTVVGTPLPRVRAHPWKFGGKTCGFPQVTAGAGCGSLTAMEWRRDDRQAGRAGKGVRHMIEAEVWIEASSSPARRPESL